MIEFDVSPLRRQWAPRLELSVGQFDDTLRVHRLRRDRPLGSRCFAAVRAGDRVAGDPVPAGSVSARERQLLLSLQHQSALSQRVGPTTTGIFDYDFDIHHAPVVVMRENFRF
ncbi:MAG: hypothetical protein ABIR20_01895 [Lysobacter sp.]